jgi:hypothetical protein
VAKRIGCFVLFALWATNAEAVELRSRFDLQANGIYRTLSQQGFSEGTDVADGMLFFGTQLLASEKDFEIEVRHELRSIFGDSPTYPTGDPARLSIRSPDRFIHLDRTFIEGEQVETVSDFERLRASYLFSAGEIWVGRRPVSLGTLSFFKVWNKFTRPVSGLFGPTIIYGSDGAGFSVQSGEFSVRGLGLLGATHEDDSLLAEAIWFSRFAEFRLLGGSWWRNQALGFAFARTAFEWMLRGEMLYLNGAGDHGASDSETQIGLGIDGAIDAEFTLLLEGYFQNIGKMDTSQYPIFDPSRFTNLRARYYAFGLLNWQASTIWKFSVGDLVNVVDGGQIFIARLSHSLSDAVEVLAEANVPVAAEGGEFSRRTFVFNDGNFLGTGNQFTAGLKATF